MTVTICAGIISVAWEQISGKKRLCLGALLDCLVFIHHSRYCMPLLLVNNWFCFEHMTWPSLVVQWIFHVVVLGYFLSASKHEIFIFPAGQCSQTLLETGITMMLHLWCVYKSCDFALACDTTLVA